MEQGLTVLTDNLNIALGEILFRLWMVGKPDVEIVELCQKDHPYFSKELLNAYKKHFKWEERKKELYEAAKLDTDKEIRIANKQKLSILHLIFNFTAKEIERDFKSYEENPVGPRPYWAPKTLKDVDTLCRLHDFVISGGVEKKHLDITKNTMIDANISDDVALKVLKILADESTQKFKLPSPSIEADFETIEQEKVV